MKQSRAFDDILMDLLKAIGGKRPADLARWLGVSQQAVGQAKAKGKIPESWAVRIAAATGISLDALLFSSSTMHEESELAMVPLVSARLSAGGGSQEFAGDVIDQYAFRRQWLERKGLTSDMVLMRVSGDSMEPMLYHNDLVLVDQGKKNIVTHSVFAIGIDDGIYVKELVTMPGRHLVLRSCNERYSPIDIDMNGDLADSVRILGKVIWWCHEV
ncbi:MAG: helix-turn-helix transcriptional regulator [Deltaproteobacteria bacterium]|nr:helix-turn-helix transcriptional regulator [Deltaproteobacteria bacterium]